LFTQIFTSQSPEEAVHLADLGVDHVGITPSTMGLPGEIDYATAARCVEALRGRAVSVALSASQDVEEIAAMVQEVKPDIVQLCGDPGAVTPAAVAQLRPRLGGAKIIQAIAMTGPEAVEAARQYARVVDYLILDSVTTEVPGVGAAGTTHDWAISAQIVREVDIPVVLAGGLSPDNVAEAIRVVRPSGVDSLTCTNRLLPAGGFEKDLDLVAAFVLASKEAAQLIS
jgi:phosphoribosylanthranilate isomerase